MSRSPSQILPNEIEPENRRDDNDMLHEIRELVRERVREDLGELVRAGAGEELIEDESSISDADRFRRIMRSTRGRTFHYYQRVVEMPVIIEPMWRIELGQPYSRPSLTTVAHETYQFFEGSYGPFTNIIVKAANINERVAQNEKDMLVRVFNHASFQKLCACGTSHGIREDKIYLAVEKCGRSLKFVIDTEHYIHPSIYPRIFKQLIEGFLFLWKLGFVHREVNCSNIFLTSNNIQAELKIGGLKQALSNDGSNQNLERRADVPAERLVYHYPGYGENNYRWGVELFLIGCVMNSTINSSHLVSSDGTYVKPTAPAAGETSYIVRNSLHLNRIMMSERLQAEVVNSDVPALSHHLFWSSIKNYTFLLNCYDYLDGMRNMSERVAVEDRRELLIDLRRLQSTMETDRDHLFNDQWPEKWLHRFSSEQVQRFLRGRPGINFRTVYGLLATLRCRGAHHHEDLPYVRAFFGALPEKYIEKWLQMFPGLVSHMVRWALKNDLHHDESFAFYFEEPDHVFWSIAADTSVSDYQAIPIWL